MTVATSTPPTTIADPRWNGDLGAVAKLSGQGLTRALLGAFAERPDSLEPEREGGRLHASSIGRWGPDLK